MSVERIQIMGIEISEGVSKKTNRPYSIGSIYVVTELAPAMGGDNISKGFMGDKFECDPVILRRVAHLTFPLTVEVEKKDVMRFGNRQNIITDIRPLETIKKAA